MTGSRRAGTPELRCGRSHGRTGVACAGLALALMLPGCGGGANADATAPGGPPPVLDAPVVAPGTWVVMGSSTAAGAGASPGQDWATLLATGMSPRQVTLHKLARSGALTYQALPVSSLPPPGRPAPDPALSVDRALEHTPRLLLLAFPTNDAVAGYGAEETVTNLSVLRQAAQARGSATVVLSSQPRSGLNPAQQAVLEDTDRRAAALFGPCFVDVRTALVGPDGATKPEFDSGDGIHLNDAGHRRLHDELSAHLKAGRCVRLAAD